MLDIRINTFLSLCKTMNYTKTAQQLNMTQPAVTQHIKYLENRYGCKFFLYDKKKLTKTEKAEIFENFCISMIKNDITIDEMMKENCTQPVCLNIGATKTIGEYVIPSKIAEYVKLNNKLSLCVDNTSVLLEMLENGRIDLAIIEGYFNKDKYEYKLYMPQRFVGICKKGSLLDNQKIKLEQLFDYKLILREKGSGTRDIFEHMLNENGFGISRFSDVLEISNFSVILQLIKNDCGISFVYESVLNNCGGVGMFEIEDYEIIRQFNYVYLKNSVMQREIVKFIEQ